MKKKNLDYLKMNRIERVKLAKSWDASHKTKHKIKLYMKHFGVDKLCAAKELLIAGVEPHEKSALKWATRHERKAAAKKKNKKHSAEIKAVNTLESQFYFVAGHTDSGFPYGITWEEIFEPDKCDTNE